MKPYVTPFLRELGRMDVVTRKSGPDTDFASEQGRTAGDIQQWCDIYPWLPWCNGTNSGASSSGAGSF